MAVAVFIFIIFFAKNIIDMQVVRFSAESLGNFPDPLTYFLSPHFPSNIDSFRLVSRLENVSKYWLLIYGTKAVK